MEQGKQIGDWKCIRILGRGSFGVVGLFKNSKTSQLTAVKKFEVRSQSQATVRILSEMQDRWIKEVEMMYHLIDCPYIVSTCPVPEDLSGNSLLSQASPRIDANAKQPPLVHLPLLCMEFCSAGDLRQMLKRPENISGLSEKEVRTVLSHVSNAISYLHEKNIIHRDLKPENILAQHDPASGKTSYKLSDLGFAKDLSNSQSLCSTVVGTMQYLAPEIYMGKRYDKTVDFWSFGVIAFEVICGMRPFLHGESPSQWIPLVEEKGKDVIAIYRTHEERIEFSKEIPYFTHCSEMLKKCLESWLPTMLQLDPNLRGKKDNQGSPAQPTMIGLSRLGKILNTKTIDIITPAKRISFAVGRTTKISEVQNWISKDTGMNIGCQLLITMDGVELTSEDLAVQFIDLSDLYLIPRTPSLVRLKSKIPMNVNLFLKAPDSAKGDPLKLRLVWSHAIYFVQTQIDRLVSMKKATEALRTWFNSTYTSNIKILIHDIEKSSACLDKVLELESQLEEIERRFGESAVIEESQTCNLKNWLKRKEELKSLHNKSLNNFVENIVLFTTRTSDIEEIFHKVLKAYEDWRSAESSGGVHCELLVRHICQFLVLRDPIIESITKNITVLLEKVESDSRVMNDLKGITSKLEELIDNVITVRCAKQTELLRISCKSKMHLNTDGGVAGDLSGAGQGQSKSSSSNCIYATSSKQMSKSAVDMSPSSSSSGGTQAKTVMAKSCNSGLPGAQPSSMGPSLSTLMEESMIWQKLSDDTLQETLGKVKSILMEKADMDWEFLELN